MSSPRRGRARAPPISAGTGRRSSTSSATNSPPRGASPNAAELTIADVDVGRLRAERMRFGTFNDAAAAAGHPETRFRRIGFAHKPSFDDIGLRRSVARFPFVPDDRRAARRGLLRGVQHPGRGLLRRVAASGAQAAGGRRLGRARFDACADRRGEGVRPARAAALGHPRLHHAGLRDRRGHQGQCLGADGGARRLGGRDRHPARRDADARATWVTRSRAASPSTTSPSRMCRRGCAPTICSASPTSARGWCSAPAISPSSRWAGAPTASATR